MYFFSSYSLKAQVINTHINESSTESILTYENLFWCFCSAFPEFWKMESSLWSSTSKPHQQICDQFLQDHFSTENNDIYTQIFHFRAPPTLKKGTDGEHEQHPPWALMSHLWYRHSKNIWGEHCRMCPPGSGTETSGSTGQRELGDPWDKAWEVTRVTRPTARLAASQGLFFPNTELWFSGACTDTLQISLNPCWQCSQGNRWLSTK